MSTDAEKLLQGDRGILAALATRLLKPRSDNFVERPWGGTQMRAFKRLPPAAGDRTAPIGESFEIAADDTDEEARRFPSVLTLDDGSSIALPALLAAHADRLLGADFVARYGRGFPLLPKFLDVAELLSVQAHPPGNTEVYVIVAAEAGATIRLGFKADVDAAALGTRLSAGRADQQRLLDLLAGALDAAELQELIKGWLAKREARPSALEHSLGSKLRVGVSWADVATCLSALQDVYWQALDALNAVAVKPGQVIYNATPSRIVESRGVPASAEAHALGNPEGRSILALEIRRPGPTLRAWDNVRFPLRPIDTSAALAALNLRATAPADFIVEPVRVRAGVSRSVDSEYFRLEHLAPTAAQPVEIAASAPHTLHVLDGAVTIERVAGGSAGELARGESAVVPVGVGAYRVLGANADVVKVDLPPYAN